MPSHLALAAIALTALLGVSPASAPTTTTPAEPNPQIDMDAYLRVAQEAAAWRESHRVNEAEFIRMSHEPGTVVLDARSADMYRKLHVKGAINLAFPDIAIESLKRTLPDHDTRRAHLLQQQLLQCGARVSRRKLMEASLNLSTFIALYSYGYRNVYELGAAARRPAIEARVRGDRGRAHPEVVHGRRPRLTPPGAPSAAGRSRPSPG